MGKGACYHPTSNRRRGSIIIISSPSKRSASETTLHYAKIRRELEIKIKEIMDQIWRLK